MGERCMVQWEPPKDDARYMLSYMLSSRLAHATSKVIEPKPLTDNDADEKPAKSLRGARYSLVMKVTQGSLS